MSENTLRVALLRMGYSNDDMTPHGFRAMGRAIMVEKLNMHPDVIEAQLAHGKSGPLGSAYDRAEFMEQRRKMMDEWANYLERLRAGVNAPVKRSRPDGLHEAGVVETGSTLSTSGKNAHDSMRWDGRHLSGHVVATR